MCLLNLIQYVYVKFIVLVHDQRKRENQEEANAAQALLDWSKGKGEQVVLDDQDKADAAQALLKLKKGKDKEEVMICNCVF